MYLQYHSINKIENRDRSGRFPGRVRAVTDVHVHVHVVWVTTTGDGCRLLVAMSLVGCEWLRPECLLIHWTATGSDEVVVEQ